MFPWLFLRSCLFIFCFVLRHINLISHVNCSASLIKGTLTWKSDLIDKMKRSFFQAAVVSILLYGCTTWTLTKRLEKKLDGNYARMLWAILNKSWRQHPTKHQLYGHLPPITKTIQVRRTRHAGHCWRSRNELISDVLLWTLTYGRAKAGWPARTYIHQLCEGTGCRPKDLPEAMNDKEKWRERVRDIRASGTTWWWWTCTRAGFMIVKSFLLFFYQLVYSRYTKIHWYFLYIYIYTYIHTYTYIMRMMSCCKYGFPRLSLAIHRFRQVFKTISSIRTELFEISFSWSAKTCTSAWKGP